MSDDVLAGSPQLTVPTYLQAGGSRGTKRSSLFRPRGTFWKFFKAPWQRTRDPLTGCLTRVALPPLVNALTLSRSDENLGSGANPSRTPYLIMLDIDNFRYLNDALGMSVCDEILRLVVRTINAVLPECEALLRTSADEFVLVHPAADATQLRGRINDLLLEMERIRCSFRSVHIQVTACAGFLAVDEHVSSDDAFRRLDLACNRAKRKGPGEIEQARDEESESLALESEVAMLAAIRAGLAEHRFKPEFQPVIHANSTSRIAYFEVLARLTTESGKPLLPSSFVPVAEKYRIMNQVDFRIMEEALIKLEEIGADASDVHLGINFSGNTLSRPDVLENVSDILSRHSFPPENLIIEITETAAISNIDQAVRFIHSMRKLGVSFAIDDFGAGLSSFNYIDQLPVDILKIDGKFIRNIHETREGSSFAIVRAIQQMAEDLNLITVAESVENRSIIDTMRLMGIQYMQGYACGGPLTSPRTYLEACETMSWPAPEKESASRRRKL